MFVGESFCLLVWGSVTFFHRAAGLSPVRPAVLSVAWAAEGRPPSSAPKKKKVISEHFDAACRVSGILRMTLEDILHSSAIKALLRLY